MIGRQIEQEALFYEIRLEERVPSDHLLRRLDAILDLSFVHEAMAKHYSAIGRPSVDPALMIRMLLVGYLFGVRSERRLCEEVDLNLAYRWFCRLGLDGRVPDHSTFTKNRHGRFRDSQIMRELFERVVEQCLAAGLASARHVAVDGSHMQADASAVRSVATGSDLPTDDPTRAVREYLADLDDAVPDLEGVRRSKPKRLSATDPAAALSAKHGPARFAYGLNAMLDTGSDIVLDVQAAPERYADEPKAARSMIERFEARHGTRPGVLTGDKGFGSGPFLAWVEDRGIEAHVPIIDRTEQAKDRLPRSAFKYDEEADRYVCPHGKILERTEQRDGIIRYRSRQRDCTACPLKVRCTTGKLRSLTRSVHEVVRERVKAREGSEAFERSMKLRRRIERLFGAIKHNDGLRRLRLRGLRGADEQFLLAATARNLKRMVSLLAPLPVLTPRTR